MILGKFRTLKLCTNDIKLCCQSKYSTIAFNRNESDDQVCTERAYLRKVLGLYGDCVLFNKQTTALGVKRANFIENKAIQSLSTFAQRDRKIPPKLMKTLNDACIREYRQWETEKLLFVLDIWDFIPDNKSVEFVKIAQNELIQRMPSLSSGLKTQTMYYLSALPKPMKDEKWALIEKLFEADIEHMSLDAISVWCLAFFKSCLPIRSTAVMLKIYERLLNDDDLKTIDEIGLVNILKALRDSSTYFHAPWMAKLLSRLQCRIENVSLTSVTHIFLLGTRLNVCNPDILDAAARRFNANLSQLRIKDIERLCLALSINGLMSPIQQDLCRNVVQQLLEFNETAFRNCVIRCIYYLIVCGFPDSTLINWALDQHNLRRIYDDVTTCYKFDREVFLIDAFAKINLCDSYRGNRLSDQQCARLAFLFNVLQLTNKSVISSQVENALNSMNIHHRIAHILPHFQKPDFVVTIDQTTGQIQSTAEPPKADSGEIIKSSFFTKDKPHVKAVAIVLAAPYQTVYREQRHTGQFQLKLEQLKLLGFHPVVIQFDEWQRLERRDRINLIEKKLADVSKGS